jgi:hypothetical protein
LGARFRTAGRREKGWAYLLVARKGPEEDLEGPDGDLGTRRRATAAAAQSSPCVRERAHAGERERYFGFLHAFLSVCASPSPWADRPSMDAKILEKEKVYFSSPNLTKVHFSFLNFKTGQTTSLNFLNRAFYLPRAVLKAVLLQ